MLPDTYDELQHRPRLEAMVRAKLGPDWQLEIVDPAAGEAWAVRGTPAVRPEERKVALAPGTKQSDAAKVAAFIRREMPGWVMVDWSPEDGYAEAARLDPTTQRLRQSIAAYFRVPDEPWRVEIACRWVIGDDGLGRLDTVELLRTPPIVPAEKRLTILQEVAELVAGDVGWLVEDDPRTGRAVLRWAPRPELPGLVPLATLLPAETPALPGDDDTWARIPVGCGVDGEPVAIDLLATPHGLMAGQTGSGKTVALVTLAVGALRRGHDLVIVDPTKSGLDFKALEPWCRAWGCESLDQAAAVLERVYAEVQRRKKFLQTHLAVKWSDLPSSVRRAEEVRPVLVIIDEVSSLLITEKLPAGIPKDHPVAQQTQNRIIAKAIIKDVIGRLAREARFAGIHLVLGIQRPDADILSGEMRANIGARVQLSAPGSPPSREAVGMLFPPDEVARCLELLETLDDGRSKGLGVMHLEGGRTVGLRVGFAALRDAPELLEDVPNPAPWDVAAPADSGPSYSPPAPPAPKPRPRPEPDVEVRDVAELELTLDDLEDDLPAAPTPVDDLWD